MKKLQKLNLTFVTSKPVATLESISTWVVPQVDGNTTITEESNSGELKDNVTEDTVENCESCGDNFKHVYYCANCDVILVNLRNAKLLK